MMIESGSVLLAEQDTPRNWPLRTEAEIIADWKGDISKPVVSICCATFNQVSYIEDAIHGFLEQVTDFPFEIIIRDDASTDGTTEIIKKYEIEYPNIIRLVVNEENKFVKGERAIHAWPAVIRGKYISLCEGDDFWIARDKLQKQFDLLVKHSDAVMCVAKTHVCGHSEGEGLVFRNTTNPPEKKLLAFEDVHRCYVHTSTYMIRAEIFKKVVEKYFSGHCLFGDTALRAILISYGPFALLNEAVSVYRVTGEGIWSSLDRDRQLQWEFDAAKKLAEMLPGIYGRHEKARLPGIAYQHLKFYAGKGAWVNCIKVTFRCVPYIYSVLPKAVLNKFGKISRK